MEPLQQAWQAHTQHFPTSHPPSTANAQYPAQTYPYYGRPSFNDSHGQRALDPMALQAQLELHLQQQPVDGHSSPVDLQTMDVYNFQDVHRRLLACNGSPDLMQMDGCSPQPVAPILDPIPTSPPPRVEDPCSSSSSSSTSSTSMCLSPPGHPVSTPMPSPQRCLHPHQSCAMEVATSVGAAVPVSPRTQRAAMFSMGYRRDCEKCRQGVPGHYMHVQR
ncbi:hypothetical protein HKX48_004493 [Thoreauomyces humboldtii]|nr:hypothetical protein HKX48_004493 [Thoreauomyces humboldtii]